MELLTAGKSAPKEIFLTWMMKNGTNQDFMNWMINMNLELDLRMQELMSFLTKYSSRIETDIEIANILRANIDPEFRKILIADKINESEK
jgi:hypothetical protein